MTHPAARLRLNFPGITRICMWLTLLGSRALLSLAGALSLLWAGPVLASPAPAEWLDDSLPAAPERDRRVDFISAHIELQVQPQEGRVGGTVTYAVHLEEGAPPLQLDAVGLQLLEATWLVRGKEVGAPAQRLDKAWRFAWPARPEGQPPGPQLLQLRVQWSAEPRQGFYFVRPDAEEPKRPLHAWTQGETEETRHWLPCPDDPDERLTWTIAVTAPRGMTILSNGEPGLRRETATTHTAIYRSAPPLPIYLLNVAVGPFQQVQHPHPKLPIHTWALPGELEHVARQFAPLPKMVDALAGWLGTPFPFSRYGQVVVHDFHFGGMENASLTTLGHRAVVDARAQIDDSAEGLLAHELAHQWFGDQVTCKSWADSWLNEGFATYLTAVWDELAYGPLRFHEHLTRIRRGYLGEAGRMQRPLSAQRFADPDDLFDGHAYSKGAYVAHMLRQKLGDQVFRAGLQKYLLRHRFSSVEPVDLRRALEEQSHQPLRAFFKRWVEQPGHPVLKAQWRWDPERKAVQLQVDQTQKPERGAPLFDLELEVAVRMKAGDVPAIHRLQLRTAHGEWSLPAPERPQLLELDPRAAILADWTLSGAVEDLANMATLSSSPEVRQRALVELGRQAGTAAAEAALLTALQKDPARHLRSEAATQLGKGQRERVLAGLQGALEGDAEPQVRAAAARSLAALRLAQGWAALEKAAKDDASDAVRRACLGALADIDRPKSAAILRQALTWPSWRDSIKIAALHGLAAVAEERDAPELLAAVAPGQPKMLREGAAPAVGQYGARVPAKKEEARRALELLLHDTNNRVRTSAAYALVALGDPAASTALLAAADREARDGAQGRLRGLAANLGRQSPLEERVRRLEEDVQRLGREAGAAHAPEQRGGNP